MHPLHNSEWRTEVNRAVRDFTSYAATLDGTALRTFLNTMLREVGEALEIEYCALVELPLRGPAVGTSYSWRRTPVRWVDEAAESRSWPALVQCLALDRAPAVLLSGPENGDTDLIEEAKAHLRSARAGS